MMKRKVLKKCISNWQLYLMILPALLYVIFFLYKPMYGIQIAFRDFNFRDGITGSEWIGLFHFERLFNSYWFPVMLKNTLLLSGLNLLLGFPFAIVFALAVNEISNTKIKGLIQTVSYAPYFISTVVLCGMLLLFLSTEYGVINHLIALFGGERIAFMQDASLFKWIYVLSGIWQNTGWNAIIYFAALSGVDKSLLEAAEIDGAGRLQRIIHINLPALIPTIVIQFILQAGRVMSLGYEKAYLLQNTMNLPGSEIINTYVYKVGIGQLEYSFSTAASLFNSVCNCILLVSVNYVAKKLGNDGLW